LHYYFAVGVIAWDDGAGEVVVVVEGILIFELANLFIVALYYL